VKWSHQLLDFKEEESKGVTKISSKWNKNCKDLVVGPMEFEVQYGGYNGDEQSPLRYLDVL
jgi:hypothetical protein